MLVRRKLFAMILAAPFALAAPAVMAAADASEKKKGGGISYIQLPVLTATAFRSDGRRGVLTLEAGIDVPDAALRTRANLLQPRLRAAYVQMLETYAGGLAGGAPPDADYISRALQTQTNQVLGRPGARFLLGSIIIN
jgi:hypothetical protein